MSNQNGSVLVLWYQLLVLIAYFINYDLQYTYDVLSSINAVLVLNFPCLLSLGHHNAGNHISAAFTSNGKHIVSACEDSNVYLWNCSSQQDSGLLQAKSVRSCERFSTNVSVAIPWCGLKRENLANRRQSPVLDENQAETTLPFSSPACFSLSQEFLLESFPKGSATWPEEKLPTSSPMAKPSILHKSQYRFLKTSCQNTSSSHAWGLVIVTAGWDGRIKSFHNYGLPVPLWNPSAWQGVFRESAFWYLWLGTKNV